MVCTDGREVPVVVVVCTNGREVPVVADGMYER